MRQFDRNARLTIYEPRAQPADSVIGAFFDLLPNAIEITSLRVQAKIAKALGSDPNTCEITVTNLNADSRAFIDKRPLHVRLDAGHDNEYRHVFSGDVIDAFTKRAGTDRETTILLGDGIRAYRHARVNRSYKAGVTVQQVLKDAAQSMGLALPNKIASSSELTAQFATGFSMHGATRDELTRLLAPYGYGWSIRNGQLRILKDEETSIGEALLLSTTASVTGGAQIIGDPEYRPPTKAERKKGAGKPKLSVQSLLYPEVTPGGIVSVQADSIRGEFKVVRVEHELDTHGTAWTTDITAKSR